MAFTTCVSNSFVHRQMCCNASITKHIRERFKLCWKCTQKPWICYSHRWCLWVFVLRLSMPFTFSVFVCTAHSMTWNNTQFSVVLHSVLFLFWNPLPSSPFSLFSHSIFVHFWHRSVWYMCLRVHACICVCNPWIQFSFQLYLHLSSKSTVQAKEIRSKPNQRWRKKIKQINIRRNGYHRSEKWNNNNKERNKYGSKWKKYAQAQASQ